MLRRLSGLAFCLAVGVVAGCGGGGNEAKVDKSLKSADKAADFEQEKHAFVAKNGAAPGRYNGKEALDSRSMQTNPHANDAMGLGGVGGLQASKSKIATNFPATREAAREDRQELGGYLADEPSGESYQEFRENPFIEVRGEAAVSTFSIDVDTASYANVRRMILDGSMPPKDAVRIEEMLNYFSYDYPQPAGETPFSVRTETAACPWNAERRLMRIALKAREIPLDKRPACNLVFLVDVSGSMNSPEKLPLLQSSLQMLAEKLNDHDRVAIVVYAGSAGLVLPSTSGESKGTIVAAIDNLRAGGSTNGGEGIRLAYAVARQNYIDGGVNRVLLATDGDFNVGVSSDDELLRLIEAERTSKIYLSVLGFGTGNLQDDKLELLADKGNGNYSYIDSEKEARKVLVEEASGTLLTVAKDVKIQIEFNPAQASAYRLIGYENRLLRTEDFHDDRKDAGEVGAGHAVTALYEIIPPGGAQPDAESTPPGGPASDAEPLVFQKAPDQKTVELTDAAAAGLLARLKLRYKDPLGSDSKLLEFDVQDQGESYGQASIDFRFAAAVAGFGMILRDSPNRGGLTLDGVLELAQGSEGLDKDGYRAEFIELVRRSRPVLARR